MVFCLHNIAVTNSLSSSLAYLGNKRVNFFRLVRHAFTSKSKLLATSEVTLIEIDLFVNYADHKDNQSGSQMFLFNMAKRQT